MKHTFGGTRRSDQIYPHERTKQRLHGRFAGRELRNRQEGTERDSAHHPHRSRACPRRDGVWHDGGRPDALRALARHNRHHRDPISLLRPMVPMFRLSCRARGPSGRRLATPGIRSRRDSMWRLRPPAQRQQLPCLRQPLPRVRGSLQPRLCTTPPPVLRGTGRMTETRNHRRGRARPERAQTRTTAACIA